MKIFVISILNVVIVFLYGVIEMKKIILNPGESLEIKSTGQYGQTMIVEVMNEGIITYRIKK